MILESLRSLGYCFESENPRFKDGYVILNAVDYGIPQTRERIFLIGNKIGMKNPFPQPTHYNPDMSGLGGFLDSGLLPYVTLFDAIGDLPRLRAKKTMTHVPKSRKDEVEKYNLDKPAAKKYTEDFKLEALRLWKSLGLPSLA